MMYDIIDVIREYDTERRITMATNVPKTDGRGIISGMYVNQNHPMDRTQWLEDTFPEWGSFLNQEIENYEVPKGQVSLWWCGGPSWVI